MITRRSFAIDLPQDHDAAEIVQEIIAMANALGLTVIAEGVETEAQRSFLTSRKGGPDGAVNSGIPVLGPTNQFEYPVSAPFRGRDNVST